MDLISYEIKKKKKNSNQPLYALREVLTFKYQKFLETVDKVMLIY